MLDPATDRVAHRRRRALLLGFHLVAVAATLPWMMAGDRLAGPQAALWFAAMAGLTAASLSSRLDEWFTWVGPAAVVALVLWLVLLTGGPGSPYQVLYVPVAAFMAVFRGTRAFGVTLALAGVALVVPPAVDGDVTAVVTELLLGAVLAATLLVVHRAAAGYRDTSRLYQLVLEHHAGPTYMLAADGTATWANQPMLRLLGLELEDVLGVPWPQFVAPGEVDRLMPQFHAALGGEPQQLTIDLDGPGGRYQLRGTVFPRYRQGRVIGVMGITEDVTELHAAAFGAEALRQTLDVLAFPVAIFDATTNELLYANGVAWWLTGAAERPDRPLRWQDLHGELQRDCPGPDASRTVSILAAPGGEEVELDVTVQRLRGRRSVLVLTGLDASDRSRRERSLMELARAEHEAADRLRDLDRMKTAFVTAVSHELRTPVTVIVGGARSLVRLRDGGTPPADRAALEDAMLRQADALALLLSDLLDVDRLTRGTLRADVSHFDVAAAVRRRVADLPEGHPVTVDAPDRLESRADGAQVERIVGHLLQNAVKYAPDAAVTVTLEPLEDDGFRLEVTDEGAGIPTEHLRRIFEPFYRADLGHPQPGTGVGLALVAEFAAINGGSAWAEQVPTGGTRVVVEIPDRRPD